MDILRSKLPQRNLCSICRKRPRYSPNHTWCKVCRAEYARENARKNYTPEKGRNAHLRRTYGITQEEYDLMLFHQGGVCAICEQPETVVCRTGQVQPLGVDHNHKTGDVRELLCNKCNVLVRFMEEDRERVKRAMKYLKKHDR